MVLSKQFDAERGRSLQLALVSEFRTQVVVRLVTAGAAVTKISAFLCVRVLPVSPRHSIAVHADACPSTKRRPPQAQTITLLLHSPHGIYSDTSGRGGG